MQTHTHTHTPADQAKEKAAQQQQELTQDQDDNYTELCNHIHGDILTGEGPIECAGHEWGACVSVGGDSYMYMYMESLLSLTRVECV